MSILKKTVRSTIYDIKSLLQSEPPTEPIQNQYLDSNTNSSFTASTFKPKAESKVNSPAIIVRRPFLKIIQNLSAESFLTGRLRLLQETKKEAHMKKLQATLKDLKNSAVELQILLQNQTLEIEGDSYGNK